MRWRDVTIGLVCAVHGQAAVYTTYIADAYAYQVSAIAADVNGNTYITGSRAVVVPPPSGAPLTDVFVSKVDPAGNVTLLATFSGKGSDEANAIAVDASGNVYIAGSTTSPNFPLLNPLQSIPDSYTGQTSVFNSYQTTAFLVKIAADGAVIYSTYLGGTMGASAMYGVAADSNGNAYVVGTTEAPDYPRTAGMPAGGVSPGEFFFSGAFFAKISAAGDQIVYAGVLSADGHACGDGSTCFLGPITTGGTAIAVDPAGNAYVAGNTGGAGLPTTAGALLTQGIGAFVAKVNAAGTGMVYVTLLGTANYYLPPVSASSAPGNSVLAIATDADGNAYISGATEDPAFPVTAGAFQTTLASPPPGAFEAPASNAFVAKINPTGSAMVWASFLGGTGPDVAQTVAPDAAGNVWVSGTAQSANFPKASGFPGGSEFLAEFDSSGAQLIYSSLSPANTVAAALVVDAGGTVHGAGGTGLLSAFTPGSAPGETAAPWLFGIANSGGGTLAGRLAPGELISLYGLHIGPATALWGSFDAAGFLPTTLGGVQVTIGGVPAPLLYVSDTQINAVAPVGATNASSTLQLTDNGAAVPDFRTVVDAADPQVFRYGSGFAAALNQDGKVNGPSNPAKAGSYVSIWATGTGYFPGSDGQKAAGADAFCSNHALACVVVDASSGNQLPVSYTGAAPGFVNGAVQVNFQVTASGSYYFAVVSLPSGYGAYSDVFKVYATP
ncbi:MAG TPA: SBBP repeat-containing protein [Bryobacteraceae bacterium]|nr:SBBP repeat-containing protein [Bryobacteraceae bacterium]